MVYVGVLEHETEMQKVARYLDQKKLEKGLQKYACYFVCDE